LQNVIERAVILCETATLSVDETWFRRDSKSGGDQVLPLTTALTENERGFFYEGKAATADITSPTGKKTNSAGDKRDGGSFEERFSKVAVWNNLMDQAEFLYAKWNEFNAA